MCPFIKLLYCYFGIIGNCIYGLKGEGYIHIGHEGLESSMLRDTHYEHNILLNIEILIGASLKSICLMQDRGFYA